MVKVGALLIGGAASSASSSWPSCMNDDASKKDDVFKNCNIMQFAKGTHGYSPEISTLVSAVVAGDLADTLISPGPFTIFAPVNDAFKALPTGKLDYYLKPENKAELVSLLNYHVLPVQMRSTDWKPTQSVKTVEGKSLQVVVDATGKTCPQSHGSKETRICVQVGNSLMNLKKHVANGEFLLSNAAMYPIDGVLFPPSFPGWPSCMNDHDSKPGGWFNKCNIMQFAKGYHGYSRQISTLVSAVVAGDLADTLTSPGPFTIFAPVNDAFKALPTGTLDDLLKPENKAALVSLLNYHVLPVQVRSTDWKPTQAVKTVEGNTLQVVVDATGKTCRQGYDETRICVQVGPSLKDLKKLLGEDLLLSNAAMYPIDGVLLPPSLAVDIMV